MKHRKGIYYTESQKSLMWDRWQRGESLHQIAVSFDRQHTDDAQQHRRRDVLLASEPTARISDDSSR